MYRKDKANAVLKLTCGGFCVCIKKFPNKQVTNCNPTLCRDYAKDPENRICSEGSKPVIYIEKKIEPPELDCPKPLPCPEKEPKIIKIQEPCDKDCGKKYNIVGIKTIQSKRQILELVDKMLKEPNKKNLDELQKVKNLLGSETLIPYNELEKDYDSLKKEVKELKNKLYKPTTTTNRPHHSSHHRPHHSSHHSSQDRPQDSSHHSSHYRYPTDYNNENNRMEERIINFERQLKDAKNALQNTPSPTNLNEIINNKTINRNVGGYSSDEDSYGLLNNKFSSNYSKCLE